MPKNNLILLKVSLLPSFWSCFTRFSPLSLVQLFSCVWLFVTPWITARQASLSITNSWCLLKLMSIESVMPSSRLILCYPLLLLPSIPPSSRVFSSESTLHMRWSKYWSFSIRASSEHPGLISFRMDWLDLFAVSRVFSNTTVGESINSLVLSFLHSPTLTSIHDYWEIHSFARELLKFFYQVFTYSIIYLYSYGLMDIYLIL